METLISNYHVFEIPTASHLSSHIEELEGSLRRGVKEAVEICFAAGITTLNVRQEIFRALHPTAMRGTYSDFSIHVEDQFTSKPSTISHVDCGVDNQYTIVVTVFTVDLMTTIENGGFDQRL
ncbi:unnamed protein product [Lactuca saligna]|uniref:Uncharacterized protein n=1 Tax=Lactuca saligna TaxID=75948 RepID=A0AA35V8V2_LACSI|nr:unnamed protein product [Lactuca saligna]